MPRTLQKSNNFNHGMIVSELVERTDLEIYNKSAALLENMTPVAYGGVRSRRGTKNIMKLQFQSGGLYVGNSTSPLGDASAIQSLGSNFQSNGIGTERTLFQINYDSAINNWHFSIFGLKFDYALPVVDLYWKSVGQNAVGLSSVTLVGGGVGFNGTYYVCRTKAEPPSQRH